MTDKQFWMKADQIADCKKTIEEKAELMAQLLKTAYDENLKLVILYQGDHLMYLNIDDDHPNTIGNRCLLCYTSKRKADADLHARSYGLDWGCVYAQEALNNFFNKEIIGYLTFNCYSKNHVISISKETLMKYIPGPYPIPEGFVDVPVSGHPVIPAEYRNQQ